MNIAIKAKHSRTSKQAILTINAVSGFHVSTLLTVLVRSMAKAKMSPGLIPVPLMPMADAPACRKLFTTAEAHSEENSNSAQKKPITKMKRVSSPTISPKSACLNTNGIKVQMNCINASIQNSRTA